MPAKDTMHIVTSPAVVADLRAVYVRAMIEGVDLTVQPRRLRGCPLPPRVLSKSALVRQAIHYGAEASRTAALPVAPALPQTSLSTDAARMVAARGSMSRAAVALAAGMASEASVRRVESGTFALAGKLKVWVESQEAGK
jgi:hypothetical protein